MKKLTEMAEVVREVEEGDAGRRGEQVEGTEPNLEKSEPTLRTADVVPRTNYTTGCQTSPTADNLKLTVSKCNELKGLLNAEEPLDVFRQKPVRVTVKVHVPVNEHPKFNFVGKLLGPRGSSLKRLQEKTRTRMAVFGSGSVRSRQKEEELLASGDPKYAHLRQPLFLQISALAAPAEAHLRIATALTEVRPYLIPDSNDLIRQRQRQELNQSRPHDCTCSHPRDQAYSTESKIPDWKGRCGGILECNVNTTTHSQSSARSLDYSGGF